MQQFVRCSPANRRRPEFGPLSGEIVAVVVTTTELKHTRSGQPPLQLEADRRADTLHHPMGNLVRLLGTATKDVIYI